MSEPPSAYVRNWLRPPPLPHGRGHPLWTVPYAPLYSCFLNLTLISSGSWFDVQLPLVFGWLYLSLKSETLNNIRKFLSCVPPMSFTDHGPRWEFDSTSALTVYKVLWSIKNALQNKFGSMNQKIGWHLPKIFLLRNGTL